MVNINQIEREFLGSRLTGVSAQTPINQMRRMFYAQYLGIQSVPTTGFKELEKRFLKKVITDNGGTPGGCQLWEQAVAELSVVPSNYENENRRLLYLNLP